MKKTEDLKTVGVVIGRFQTQYLHEGHVGLLDYVTEKHKNVVVFLGIPKIQNSKRNPLDFVTRKMMIQAKFPSVTVLPISDNRSDAAWSANIDTLLRTIFPDTEAVLYGSRDSFIPSYQGSFATEAYPQVDSHNATNLREEAASEAIESEDFRAGVIYGIHKQRPVTYPTVDIVLINGDKILLGRKPTEKLFRFVGGFVDRTDKNWESAARRELKEETNLDCLSLDYVCSQAIDDWRYSREENGIMTTLFKTYAWDEMGKLEASDDIAEVKYFDIKDFLIKDFIEENIVYEHVELMKTFIFKHFNTISN